MSKEFCVICGKVTPYYKKDHVDKRSNYVEGCGQLCNTCYNAFHSNEYTPLEFFGNKKTQKMVGIKEMATWSIMTLVFVLGIVMISQFKMNNADVITNQQDSIRKLNDSILRLNLKMDYYYDHSEIR